MARSPGSPAGGQGGGAGPCAWRGNGGDRGQRRGGRAPAKQGTWQACQARQADRGAARRQNERMLAPT